MWGDVTDTATVGWIVSERRVVATVRTATRRGRELGRLLHFSPAFHTATGLPLLSCDSGEQQWFLMK